jgi:glucokinase
MHSHSLAIGIDIGGTNVRAARVDASGQILDRLAEKTLRDAPMLTSRLVAMIHTLDRPGVSTVGIGVPGRVDARRNQVLSGGYVDLSTLPLAETIEHETGKRVFIDNDCNMALAAEIAVGAARGCRHVAMLTVGTGIGGAVVLEGAVLRGRRSAGQLGHVTVEAGGLACNCGRRGCVETTSSGTALARHIAQAGLPPASTAEEVLAAARSGDARAIRVIQAWAGPLRAAIDSIVATVDPELFLLGGGLGGAACAALEWAPAPSPWYQCPVRPATLGDDAGVIGAALAGAEQDTLVS